MRTTSYYSLLLLIPVAVFIWAGCGKDKLRSKPSIKLKSINTRELATVNDPFLIVEFDYADKEGDIGGTNALWIKRTFLNKRVTSLISPDSFSIDVPVPVVPRMDGQIEARIRASNLYLAETPTEPDSLNIRFVLRDAGGNISDTLDIGMVVILR